MKKIAIILFIAVFLYTSSAFGASLVGQWSFSSEDNVGGTRYSRDGSGLSNDGVVTGAQFHSDGIWGGYYSFDGNDYINIGNKTSLNTPRTTVSAWMRTTKNTTQQYAYSNMTASTGTALGLYSSRFIAHTNTNSWEWFLTNLYPSANEWYHVVMTHDGTTQKLYVNGQFDNSWNHTYNLPTTIESYIGRYYGGAYFTGDLDEIMVWDAPLTASEVTNLYNSYAVPEPSAYIFFLLFATFIFGFFRKKI